MTKIFRCRFALKDGYKTFIQIKGVGLTEKRAMYWAEKEVLKRKNFLKVDCVYDVTEEVNNV